MLMYAWNTTKAKTDEEYREVLRKRQKRFFILGMVGVIAIMIGLYFSTMAKGPQEDFMSGFYTDIGFGVTVASIVLFWKKRKLLKDAKALRAARLKEQDERVSAITQKALSIAGLGTICFVYAGFLIFGFLDRTVYYTLMAVFWIFVLLFLAFRIFYEKKM